MVDLSNWMEEGRRKSDDYDGTYIHLGPIEILPCGPAVSGAAA